MCQPITSMEKGVWYLSSSNLLKVEEKQVLYRICSRNRSWVCSCLCDIQRDVLHVVKPITAGTNFFVRMCLLFNNCFFQYWFQLFSLGLRRSFPLKIQDINQNTIVIIALEYKMDLFLPFRFFIPIFGINL